MLYPRCHKRHLPLGKRTGEETRKYRKGGHGQVKKWDGERVNHRRCGQWQWFCLCNTSEMQVLLFSLYSPPHCQTCKARVIQPCVYLSVYMVYLLCYAGKNWSEHAEGVDSSKPAAPLLFWEVKFNTINWLLFHFNYLYRKVFFMKLDMRVQNMYSWVQLSNSEP